MAITCQHQISRVNSEAPRSGYFSRTMILTFSYFGTSGRMSSFRVVLNPNRGHQFRTDSTYDLIDVTSYRTELMWL